LISLCTYNERDNLAALICEIHVHAPQADVLVVDDNSPDGTGILADEAADTDSRIHVLHRAGKLGLGSATLAAYEYAIEHEYAFLLNMDADFSHHPRYISSLLECMDAADVAIGSRYVTGGSIVGWGFKRHFMSRCVNLYARLLLGLKTRDNSGAFRCHRVAKLRELDFTKIRATGYAFQEEVLYRLSRVGCRFKEFPIVFEDRRYGRSKINIREALVALWVIFLLAIDRLRGV
jgi:dolichol-phosphate mannosyltransferase